MSSNIDSVSDSSRKASPSIDQPANTSINASSPDPTHKVDSRKQPWRSLPEFKDVKDDVSVKNQRDMRLFGNHVNAHSWVVQSSNSRRESRIDLLIVSGTLTYAQSLMKLSSRERRFVLQIAGMWDSPVPFWFIGMWFSRPRDLAFAWWL